MSASRPERTFRCLTRVPAVGEVSSAAATHRSVALSRQGIDSFHTDVLARQVYDRANKAQALVLRVRVRHSASRPANRGCAWRPRGGVHGQWVAVGGPLRLDVPSLCTMSCVLSLSSTLASVPSAHGRPRSPAVVLNVQSQRLNSLLSARVYARRSPKRAVPSRAWCDERRPLSAALAPRSLVSNSIWSVGRFLLVTCAMQKHRVSNSDTCARRGGTLP